MVLIREENPPPCKWLLGRVVKIYMGKDKKVKVVDIKTGLCLGYNLSDFDIKVVSPKEDPLLFLAPKLFAKKRQIEGFQKGVNDEKLFGSACVSGE
ncbi:hypothetical protein TNCV_87061 [Trichonephila clavipes]|nr:hypothetical protein TNCV_87061 [Trichonephila clavipes]